MNDKCASGTGATIDKCFIKVGMPVGRRGARCASTIRKLHHVAAKCGVFAETDIVNLVKAVDPLDGDHVLAGRRHRDAEPVGADPRATPCGPRCCCWAGPTPTCPSCRTAGASASPRPGTSRGYDYPKDVPLEELIIVPENAQYYAAFGAVMYGLHEPAEVGAYAGIDGLKEFIARRPQGQAG